MSNEIDISNDDHGVTVLLQQVGEDKDRVIQLVSKTMGRSVADVTEMVKGPLAVKVGLGLTEAKELRRTLEEAGATALVIPDE